MANLISEVPMDKVLDLIWNGIILLGSIVMFLGGGILSLLLYIRKKDEARVVEKERALEEKEKLKTDNHKILFESLTREVKAINENTKETNRELGQLKDEMRERDNFINLELMALKKDVDQTKQDVHQLQAEVRDIQGKLK